MRVIERDEVARRLSYEACIPIVRQAMIDFSSGSSRIWPAHGRCIKEPELPRPHSACRCRGRGAGAARLYFPDFSVGCQR